MADAAIHNELVTLRAAIEAMHSERDVLRDRDERLANKLSEVEASLTRRIGALETAFVAGQGRGGDGDSGPGLRHRAAEKFMPDVWSGDKGASPFSDFAYEVENYLSVLEPGGSGSRTLAWAAARKEPITTTDVEDLDLDEEHPHAKAINVALAHLLTKVTTGTAKTMVKQAGPGCGLRAWQNLARWYRPRSAMDQATSITMVMNPGQCRDMGEMHRRLEEWEVAVREHEARFDDRIQESVRTAALLSMIPKGIYEQRFKGRAYDSYLDLRQELGNYLADRRPTIQVKAAGQDSIPMEIGELGDSDPLTRLSKEVGSLNAFVKRKGKGKKGGEQSGWTQSSWQSPQWTTQPKGSGKSRDEGKGTKGAGKGKAGKR